MPTRRDDQRITVTAETAGMFLPPPALALLRLPPDVLLTVYDYLACAVELSTQGDLYWARHVVNNSEELALRTGSEDQTFYALRQAVASHITQVQQEILQEDDAKDFA